MKQKFLPKNKGKAFKKNVIQMAAQCQAVSTNWIKKND
jgi:hypothetical protein